MVFVVIFLYYLVYVYSVIGIFFFDDMGVVVIDGYGGSVDSCNDINGNVFVIDNIYYNNCYCYWEICSYYVY